MNYPGYLAQVRTRLEELGFAAVNPPADLATGLGLTLEREESWGRLTLALPPEVADATDAPTGREALAKATANWVRIAARRAGERRYLILVFPFAKAVSEDLATAVKALRQEDPKGLWGVVCWPADLEVELIDRPSGFPRVEDRVVRALTEVPRGTVESFLRESTGPRLGAKRAWLGDLGYVPTTRIILAATIAYYLWVLLISGGIGNLIAGPDLRTLITWGANDGRLVIGAGQHWRLLTHLLLHGGLIHLGFNMWAFWSLGRHVELIYGSGRMAYIYVFAGVAGGLASTVLRFGYVPSVGASGAILGLMGAMVYFSTAMRGRVDWRAVMGPVAINLFYGFVMRGIDNYAHIGGFIGGLIAAFLVGIPGQRSAWRSAAMIAGGVALGIVLSGLLPLPHLGLF